MKKKTKPIIINKYVKDTRSSEEIKKLYQMFINSLIDVITNS